MPGRLLKPKLIRMRDQMEMSKRLTDKWTR